MWRVLCSKKASRAGAEWPRRGVVRDEKPSRLDHVAPFNVPQMVLPPEASEPPFLQVPPDLGLHCPRDSGNPRAGWGPGFCPKPPDIYPCFPLALNTFPSCPTLTHLSKYLPKWKALPLEVMFDISQAELIHISSIFYSHFYICMDIWICIHVYCLLLYLSWVLPYDIENNPPVSPYGLDGKNYLLFIYLSIFSANVALRA